MMNTSERKSVLPWPLVLSELLGFMAIVLGYAEIKQYIQLPLFFEGQKQGVVLIIVGVLLMLPAGVYLVSGWFSQIDQLITPHFSHSSAKERKKNCKETDNDTDH
ncbi:MAG: DUF1418 family protein [Plesiomonas sp.]|uniref:DUF1418 family protein n=1 Tax=Plesiomonas sp. TaxID=2486279 RepID=UPI003F341D4B